MKTSVTKHNRLTNEITQTVRKMLISLRSNPWIFFHDCRSGCERDTSRGEMNMDMSSSALYVVSFEHKVIVAKTIVCVKQKKNTEQCLFRVSYRTIRVTNRSPTVMVIDVPAFHSIAFSTTPSVKRYPPFGICERIVSGSPGRTRPVMIEMPVFGEGNGSRTTKTSSESVGVGRLDSACG